MSESNAMNGKIKRTDVTPSGNPVYEWSGNDGSIVAIPDGGEIFIPSVSSGDEIRMKDLVSAVVDELGNEQLCFSNVINSELKDALDGFREEQEFAPNYGEHVTVLRGEWDE